MAKFEQPVEEPKPEKAKSLTKAALLAAIGLGMLQDAPTPQESPQEHSPFTLSPEIASKFKFEKKIDGALTLIHVGQIHSVGEIAVNRLTGFAPYIIKNQKDIEQVLLQLKAQRGIDTVFLEGMDINAQGNNLLALLPQWDALYEEAVKTSDTEKAMNLVNNLVINYGANVENQPNNHTVLGMFGYYLRTRVQKFAEFTKTHPHSEAVGTALAGWLEDIKTMELIDGDNIYISAGAVAKLWIEGKIKVQACDDPKIRAAGVEFMKHAPGKNAPEQAQKEFEKAFYDLNQGREDTVVKTVTEWMGKEHKTEAIVVFGNSHDFSGNARAYNKTATASATCGVIKLDSLVSKELDATNNPFLRVGEDWSDQEEK